ncbi:PREDICTED: WAT1-related protein At1g21890-like [Fragaria vesca subsp. vesca]|uniref:WAT1-related protein At1g21890-like n=1 Tax=Fragaria vesca subsp. vesca TaxID=101020 RepID=UPI0002C345CC|nr:PREDICTED: WAT1-related protein At1g21890-like [Fragaria vesca subsp. vesca]
MADKGSNERVSMFLNKIKPYLAMVSLQFGYAGMYIISMVGLKRGMNHFVLATYRHFIAFAVIAPFALVLERKVRPKLTLPIFLRIMVLGFLEPVLAQNLYFVGMTYTSATFASATANILPAITFIFALIFRLEKVNFKKIPSVAKVIGTVITVSGAMLMTFYKGPIVEFISAQASHHATSATATDKHWVLGTVMLLARCCGWSGFFILQSFTLKVYPAELSLTALICFMGALEGAVATLVIEHNMSVWVIGWDSRLLAAAYSGIVCSGIAFYVQGIVMKEQGPVFVTAFSPLAMIITAALAAIILSEQVRLGSVIGTMLIVIGLYAVVWGKSKERSASMKDVKTIDHELPITNVATISSTTVDSKNDAAGLKENVVKIPINPQES